MKNALNCFSKKNLLEIDNFESSYLQTRFHEVADVLLNQSIINVGEAKYRICEIEFYVHSANHQDPYTHQHPEQLKFGNWYFHQIKTKLGFSFKGGNYKGIDLTLGNDVNFAGVLIRSVEKIENAIRIEGPSLVVDAFLSDLESKSVADLYLSTKPLIFLQFDANLDSREFVMGPRIGLRPSSNNDEISRQFMFKPFRYISQPTKAKIGKPLLFLHQVSLYGLEVAIMKTSVREGEANKYMTWFESGMAKSLAEVNFGRTIKSNCIYFGAVFGFQNPTQATDSAEVTIEKVLEMAVEAFKSGELKELKYYCDLGLESCGPVGLGLEFLKLRGIMFAQSHELTKARQDFLAVLQVEPNDEIAFTNYITASLASGDSPSVITALNTFYPSLNRSSQGLVLGSISEAIKSGAILVEDLPVKVLNDLSKALKVKTVA